MKPLVWMAALAGLTLLAGEGPAAAQAARFVPALSTASPLLIDAQFRGGRGMRPRGGPRRGGMRHGGGFGHRPGHGPRPGFGHRPGYGHRPGFGHRPGYGHRYRRGIGAGVAGFAAGAVLGSTVSNGYGYGYGGPAYAYPATPPVGIADATAYCAQRFKSYKPTTGTYTGYDGKQHPCP